MIHKVKPATPLRLVHSSGQTKNDLGGQSGDSYSQNSRSSPAETSPSSEAEPPTPEDPLLSTPAVIGEQIGLSQVVQEWKEQEHTHPSSMTQAKLAQKYQGDAAPAKGMLLNKKIT